MGVSYLLLTQRIRVNIGIVNISETHQKQFQIGIINYCPNNTIPIMIVANYCVKE
ncbi:LA_2272 family surface repeat-containing protein [Leptospira borgpetersenii]|uniref:LA_2272 family surface repeat-containing protein n=1 Tax=Leptospira borgpetersenii TaxID=174 RepID=UPI003D16E5EC